MTLAEFLCQGRVVITLLHEINVTQGKRTEVDT